MPMTSQERNKYQEDYKRNNYDIVKLLLVKGLKDELKTIAKNKGLSVNALINLAIQDYISRNGNFQQSKTPDD